MRKIALFVLLFCFASIARAQTGTIALTVTSTPTNIVVNVNCKFVVIQENSAAPTNAFTIKLPGNANGVTYAAGNRFIFAAAPGGFNSGQTIGTIAVASGSVSFVGIESIDSPTVPAAATIIDGVTAPKPLTFNDSASVTWSIVGGAVEATATGGGGGAVSSVTGTTNQITCSPTTGAVICGFAAAPILPNGTTATTQSPGDNTTKVATDAFVAGNSGSPLVENVSCSNSQGWAGSDIGAWINAAMAALPSTGGEVYVAAGACSFSTTVVITKNVFLAGAGRTATILTYSGTGDAVDMEAGNAAPYMNGAIVGIDLVGNSNANSVGIHHIDTIGSLYDDLTVENFNGTNGVGMWFDNQILFSERLSLRKLSVYRNTVGWKMSNTDSAAPFNSNSMAYWRVSEVHFQVAASQTAIVAAGCVSCGSGTNATNANGIGVAGPFSGVSSMLPYNIELAFDANLEASSSTIMALSKSAAFGGARFDINAECTGCTGATAFSLDATSTIFGDPSAHISIQGTVNSLATGSTFLPQGPINGTGNLLFSNNNTQLDPSLLGPTFFCDSMSNCPSFQPLGAATSGGNFNSTPLYFNGSGWIGSASTCQWKMQNVLGTGTNPTFTLQFSPIGCGIGYGSVAVPTFTVTNNLLIPFSNGFAASAQSNIGIDTGGNNFEAYLGSANAIIPHAITTWTNGDCLKASTSAGSYGIADSGSTNCGAFSGGLGNSYQDVAEIAPPSNPTGSNDRLYLSNATHLLSCVTSGGINCMPSSGGGGGALSALTVATSTNSINNGNFQQTWNWQLTGSSNEYGHLYSENTASTNSGTSYLFGIHTLSGSTINPLEVDANGIGWYMNPSGLWRPLSTGTLATGGTAHGFTISEANGAIVSLVCALNLVPTGQGSSSDPICAAPSVLWNNIGNPGGNLSLTMGSNLSTFNYTTALNNAFSWQNNTAATSGTAQSSPVLNLCGQGWEGGSPANTQDCWQFQNSIANGANPNVTGVFSFTGSSTGHYAIQVPNLINLGIAANNLPYGGGTGLQGSVSAPSANGQYVCGYAVSAASAVPPTCPLLGLGTNSVTGANSTYTVTYAQNATVTTHDIAGSAAVNVTLPTATTLGNAAFVWKYCNHSTQTDTITPTTWTIQAGTTAGAATLSVSPGVCYNISVDANSSTQWHADGTNTGGGGGGTATGYSCTMTTTTCTATVASVTSPICIASLQSTSTVIASNCSVTSTTATVTAGSSNTGTWGIALLSAPGSGSSFVRINTYTASCAASTTPCNATVTVPMGDLAVVDVYTENSGAISLTTDSNSSTYSNAFNDTAALQGGNGSIREDFVCQASGAITTIHGNVPGGTGGSAVVVRVYSGASASCGDQVSSPATNTGTTQTAGSITTSGSRLITGIFFQNTTDTNAFTGSGIYGNSVNQGNAPTGTLTGGVDALNEPASSYAATATTTGSVGWYGRTTSYK